MGYRSDVAISMRAKDFVSMYYSAGQTGEEAVAIIDDADKFFIKRTGIVNLVWTSIKWYSEYKGVAFVREYLDSIPHAIRTIGEDMEDVGEEINCDDDDLWGDLIDAAQIERCINVDGEYDHEYLQELLDLAGLGEKHDDNAASIEEISNLLE